MKREIPLDGNQPCEVQITDSTFAILNYSAQSNSGEIELFSSQFKGDTLLVYDLEGYTNAFENDSLKPQQIIIAAYLMKRGRLLPIYWDYPKIYPKADFKYFYNDSDNDYFGKLDESRVKKFPVNWNGTTQNFAYINGKGIYHKKGKFKEMRRNIRYKNHALDSTLWDIRLPNVYANDSVIIKSEWIVRYGTLKTKKGTFIDLR